MGIIGSNYTHLPALQGCQEKGASAGESTPEVKEPEVRRFLHPDRQPKITQDSRRMEGTTMGKFKGH